MAETKQTAAERLRAKISARPAELETVTTGSGLEFVFRKPNRAAMMFGNELPRSLVSKSIAAWAKNEKGSADAPELTAEEQAKTLEISFQICDEVIRHSHEPRLVYGAPESENELSIRELPDEDLADLFSWMQGGKVSNRLENFPGERQRSAVARSHRALGGKKGVGAARAADTA